MYNCCIGGKKDKFVIANGKGGNGKGLLNELLKMMLGDYAYEAPISLLTREFRGGANPEIANINKKRLVLFKEPDKSERLFLANVKALCDNDTINARQLYKSICKVYLMATLILETNTLLKFSGKADEAEMRRFMDLLFESMFTDNDEFLNDKDLKNVYSVNKYYKSTEFQKLHVCALFKYILDNAEKEIYNPPCVRERTKCYIESEDTFRNWYQENYTFTDDKKNDYIKIKDMFDAYKESDEYKNTKACDRPNLTRFKNFMVLTDNKLSSRYRDRYRPYSVKGSQKEIRNVLLGMQEKEEDSDDED